MLTVLLTKARAWALTALAVVAVLVGAYAWGGRRAKHAAALEAQALEAARARKVEEAVRSAAEDRNHVDQDVGRMPPGRAAERLRDEWSRDRRTR